MIYLKFWGPAGQEGEELYILREKYRNGIVTKARGAC